MSQSDLLSCLSRYTKLTIVNEAGGTRVGVLEGDDKKHLATMSWHSGPDLVTVLQHLGGISAQTEE